MPDFAKTIIYKIEHSDDPSLCYVGNTTNYAHRKNQHKSRSQNPNDKEFNVYKYKMIRENGGWDKFLMKPIKEFPCKTRIEAEIEEEKCRIELKATLNKNKCHADANVKQAEKQAEKMRKYREANSVEIQKYKSDKVFLSLQRKKYTADDLE
jgi:hypothetical protein